MPDAGGLQPNDSPLRVDFWRDRDGVVTAVNKLNAQPPIQIEMVPGCGEIVAWKDGLTLTFIAGDFRGWQFQGGSAGVICG